MTLSPPHPIPTDKKRAESKEQQLKGLLSRIDELQAQNQQLQEGAAATAGLKSQLANAKSQLQDARKQHQQEVEVLKQQLEDAHRKLQRTQSSSLNNAADSEALRQQATTSQAAADAAQAELAQLRQKHSQVAAQAEKAEKEKQLLLTNLQSLIKLNAELQAALTIERQQRVSSRLSTSGVHSPCKHSLTMLKWRRLLCMWLRPAKHHTTLRA